MPTYPPSAHVVPRAAVAMLGLLGMLLMPGLSQATEVAKTATPLFNGRNLDGWDVFLPDRATGAPQDIFQATDGVIHVYKDAEAGSRQPMGYLITSAEHGDYRLTLEYKWGEKKFVPRAAADIARDAGVCYHVQSPNTIWPVSAECQIQEGDTGDAWLIQTRATSRVHPDTMGYWPSDRSGGVEVTKGEVPKVYRRFLRFYCHEQPGWNRIELIVRGDRATYLVNGRVVNEVTQLKKWDEVTASWQPLTKGKVLLQAEGAEIFYRNITLQPLEPPPAP